MQNGLVKLFYELWIIGIVWMYPVARLFKQPLCGDHLFVTTALRTNERPDNLARMPADFSGEFGVL